MKILTRLWRDEPVLVATVVPILTTVGIISADQASAVTNAVAGVVAIGVQVAAAFGVRSTVRPTSKAAPTP